MQIAWKRKLLQLRRLSAGAMMENDLHEAVVTQNYRHIAGQVGETEREAIEITALCRYVLACQMTPSNCERSFTLAYASAPYLHVWLR